jgi:hypothetical protein
MLYKIIFHHVGIQWYRNNYIYKYILCIKKTIYDGECLLYPAKSKYIHGEKRDVMFNFYT